MKVYVSILIPDALIQPKAAPPMPAWFAMNVLLYPLPLVAFISLHNAAPYSPAILDSNTVFTRFILEALQSIAPPFITATLL